MLHTTGGSLTRPPSKIVFRAKRLYFSSVILLILCLFYTFATTINSTNIAQAEVKTYVEHIVKPGENLWVIASHYRPKNMDIREYVDILEQENGVTPVIQVGDKLRVPLQ